MPQVEKATHRPGLHQMDGEFQVGAFPKKRGKTPKMDGENNGKPY